MYNLSLLKLIFSSIYLMLFTCVLADAELTHLLARLEATSSPRGLLDGGCMHHTTSLQQQQQDNQSSNQQQHGSYSHHHQGCATSRASGSDPYGVGPWYGGLGRGRKMANSGGSESVRPRLVVDDAAASEPLSRDQSGDSVVQQQQPPPQWQRLMVKTISCMLTSLLTVWAGRADQPMGIRRHF